MRKKQSIVLVAILLVISIGVIPQLATATETYTFVSTMKAYPQIFSDVRGIAVDSSGNIFVVDSDKDTILKYSSDFTPVPITFAGSFTFNFLPGNIVFDNSGNIYISDENSVRKFSSSGSLLATLGTWTAVSNYPGGIAVDSQSNVYATAPTQGKVYKFTYNSGDGHYDETSWSSPSGYTWAGPMRIAVHDNLVYIAQASSNELLILNPSGGFVDSFPMTAIADSLSTDGAGNIYADYMGMSYVEKFSPSGVASTTYARWQILNSYGVAVDSAGYVYVSDNGNSRILKFNQAGDNVAIYNGYCNFKGAYSVSVDSTGNIFLADFVDDKILKFTSTHIQLPISFGDATFSFFNTPGHIAFDSSGNIFISDDSGVRKFSSTGTLSTSLGTWGGDNFPAGIAIDGSNVYATAPAQNRIYKFTPNGVGGYDATWFTGTEDHPLINPQGIAVYGGRIYMHQGNYNNQMQVLATTNGGYLTSFSLSGSPDGMAADGSGNLYVTYPLLNRVEKFSSAGQLLASIGESGPGDGQFANCRGIAVDSAGYVYVGDGGRIQKFSPPVVEPEPQPLVVLSPAQGVYGTNCRVNCSGFAPYSDITVTLEWSTMPVNSRTDGDGVYDSLTALVPTELEVGRPYAITATGTTPSGAPASATAYFTVTPLNSLAFDTIDSPQTAGTPFSITVRAIDFEGNALTDFDAYMDLTCSNGAVISPISVRFVKGVWTGNVQIASAATSVTINAKATNGALGSSNTFTIIPGAVVPEYPIGSLAFIIASLCAFSIYKKHRSHQQIKP